MVWTSTHLCDLRNNHGTLTVGDKCLNFFFSFNIFIWFIYLYLKNPLLLFSTICRSRDIINPICTGIRGMAELGSSFRHCHCCILRRLVNPKMYGCRSKNQNLSRHRGASIWEQRESDSNSCYVYRALLGGDWILDS